MNSMSAAPNPTNYERENLGRVGANDERGKDVLVISVGEILENLLELQNLDSQIAALKRTGEVSPDLKGKQEELKRVSLREQEKLKSIDDLRLNRNQTKSALEICRQRILKADAASKDIKSASVFQAIIKEIDQLKTLEQDLEVKDNSITKDFEALQAQLSEIQNERTNLENSIGSASGIKKEKERGTEGKIREIESLKNQVISKIPASNVALYTRLIQARGGVAISRILGSACGACHMTLPPQFFIQLGRSPNIEQCPNCHRILVPLRIEKGGH